MPCPFFSFSRLLLFLKLILNMFCLVVIFILAFLRISDCTYARGSRSRENSHGLEICEYLIRSLPIPMDHPFWDRQLHLSEQSLPTDIQIICWLMDVCLQQYDDLMRIHYTNIERINRPFSFAARWNRSATRRSLLVIDLDESVLYAKESPNVKHLSLSHLRTHNVDDLKFAIFPFGNEEKTTQTFITYRPNLMSLIMNNINFCDFIVYTKANKNYAIFNMLMIEMYYNFVWRLNGYSQLTMDSMEFRFIHLIARMPGVKQKSIGTLNHCQCLSMFENVYIIDDLFEGDEAVWSKQIPGKLRLCTMFHSFNIPAFKIKKALRTSHHPPSLARWPDLRTDADGNELLHLNLRILCGKILKSINGKWMSGEWNC